MKYDLDWLIIDYGTFLQKFGLDETSVRGHFGDWKERSGSDSARDYLWYLFQVILGETAKQVSAPIDLQKNNLEIMTAMWFFRTHVEVQAAPELQQRINETRIRLWELELPYYFRVKLLSDNCCAYCDAFNEALFTPQDLLQQSVFSTRFCTSEAGCSCTLLPVAERDAENKIRLREPGTS